MKLREAMEKDSKHVFQSYRRTPLLLTRGRGVYVYDDAGRRYLDLLGGLAVNSLGHANPRVAAAIGKQARTLSHVSNLYYTEPMLRLAGKLCSLSGMDRVFFCNSGAEANEGAIKLARKYFSVTLGKKEKFEIVTMLNSFHGRTMATLTATGQAMYQEGYAPLLPGIKYATLNDLASVKKLVGKNTAAIMVEPVQGESGVFPCSKEFVKGLDELRKKHGLLLIFDEVQCGLGRTGKWFGWQHFGVKPDIMTVAKPLGGGLPLGAMMAGEKVSAAFTPGSHASTFGANPVACAAGNEFIAVMEDGKLVKRAAEMGAYIKKGLAALSRETGMITDIRVAGLMVGVDIKGDARAAAAFFLENGVLVNAPRENTIRILPPLIITEAHADVFLRVLGEFLGKAGVVGKKAKR